MTEEDYLKSNIKIAEGETKNDKPSQPNPLLEIDDLINSLRAIKKPLLSAPTFTPRNFIDRFQVYNNNLYFYISPSYGWKLIG